MKEFSRKCKLMGSAFELLVVEEEPQKADLLLNAGIEEIRRIENLLSEFLPDSDTSRLNNHAWNEPVTVDKECFDLIERCIGISKLTEGNFDISVSPLKKLYSFKNAQFEMPAENLIRETLTHLGFRKILTDRQNRTISFDNNRMRISFSAIGKGYASDMVKQLWLGAGVKSGFINASGDLNAFGSKPDGSPWKIGIADPDDRNKILLFIPLYNASVATSGDYEQFFMVNNVRYSHTINPLTGMPVTGVKSVTVFSPGAELSDALATAVNVMGVRKGIDFINQLPHTHCIMIDDKNKVYFSNKMKYEEVSV